MSLTYISRGIFPPSCNITLKISHVNEKHDCDGKNIFRMSPIYSMEKRAHAQNNDSDDGNMKSCTGPFLLGYIQQYTYVYTLLLRYTGFPSILCAQYTARRVLCVLLNTYKHLTHSVFSEQSMYRTDMILLWWRLCYIFCSPGHSYTKFLNTNVTCVVVCQSSIIKIK